MNNSYNEIYNLYKHYSTIESEPHLKEYLSEFLGVSYDIINEIKNIRVIYNDYILKFYPNEITIKSCFINKVLLKGKTHVSIFELPVEKSRVDLCKINGTSIAYEIKTDFDNFNRLEKQIHDYSKVFEKTYLICSKSNLELALDTLPDYCGIYLYHISKKGNVTFKEYKKASVSPNLNSLSQLKTLNKSELCNLSNHHNKQTLSKQELVQDILNHHSKDDINHHFKHILKKRYYKNWNFIKDNHDVILEIDYQWFFKNCISPDLIYKNR